MTTNTTPTANRVQLRVVNPDLFANVHYLKHQLETLGPCRHDQLSGRLVVKVLDNQGELFRLGVDGGIMDSRTFTAKVEEILHQAGLAWEPAVRPLVNQRQQEPQPDDQGATTLYGRPTGFQLYLPPSLWSRGNCLELRERLLKVADERLAGCHRLHLPAQAAVAYFTSYEARDSWVRELREQGVLSADAFPSIPTF